MIQHTEKSKRVNLKRPLPIVPAAIAPSLPATPVSRYVDDCFEFTAAGCWSKITPDVDPCEIEKHGYTFSADLGDNEQMRIFESTDAVAYPWVAECSPLANRITYVYLRDLPSLLAFLKAYKPVLDLWQDESEVARSRTWQATDAAREFLSRKRR